MTITLIIPVYNVEKYLENCLDSVVEQTIPFDEVILINDGSTDNSMAICERYKAGNKNFKLIKQKNMGLSEARNVGINNSISEYIMFLDSDDYLKINAVEKLKKKLEHIKYDAIFFDANIICEEGVGNNTKCNRKEAGIENISLDGWSFLKKCYPQYYIVSACLAVYRKDVIVNNEIFFPKGLYYEDNYFLFAFLICSKNVSYIPEMFYQRRCRKNSITTGKYSEKKFKDYIKVTLLILEEIIQNDYTKKINYASLLIEFINDYCRGVLNNYQRCQKECIVLSKGTKNIFYTMLEKYTIILDTIYLSDDLEALPLLNSILENLDRIYCLFPEIESRVKDTIRKIIKSQIRIYKKLLRGLFLDKKDKKVAIYGTGKHTEGLFEIYKKIFGNILCDIVFLDSYINRGIFRGYEIINYKKIDNSFFEIIISSFLYENEMFQNIRKIDKNVRVYTFYRMINEDVFSNYRIFLKYYDI